MFLSQETLKKHFYIPSPTENKPPTGVDLYARFALAGALCCAITHGGMTPVDVVKTRIQLEPERYTGVCPIYFSLIVLLLICVSRA